jgi:polysaccharide biosynthesis protein VpsQ
VFTDPDHTMAIKQMLTKCNTPGDVPPSRSLWLRFSILYTVIFGVILVLAYLGRLPGFFANIDKPGHLILYGIFTFLGHRCLYQRRLGRLPLFPTLFGLFTLTEELVQSLSPHRTFDLWDLVCSLVGIGLGYGLANWQIRRSAQTNIH